jgi:cytochrome c oxidase assembly protein subunit 15
MAVVATTVLLIGLGAMVTSTGSGMAFADWPLADGSVWPQGMELDGLLEHSHRVVGALVGLMVLVLTIWVGRREARAWLRKLTTGALGLVVIQGVVGGFGVLKNLPVANSVAHGVLAQLTLCALGTVAFALSPAWNLRVPVDSSRARLARKLCVIAVALVFVQTLLGAMARHSDNAAALWSHVAFALVVALAVLITSAYCSGRFPEVPDMGRNGRWILGILITQLVLGFVALAVRTGKDPSNITSLGRSALISSHVLVGSVLVLLCAVLMLRGFRNLAVTGDVVTGAGTRPK